MLNVSILWHMHQPYYVNPVTKTAMMPWVRLHAVKGYLDMIAMAERHPKMRMTFNMTPVLVKQILELDRNEVKDLWGTWSLTPARDLTPELKKNLLEHFFKANWDHLIRPYARFHELLTRRGYDTGRVSLEHIIHAFSTQDYLDLQVWFNLAWCGYTACREHPILNELKKKGCHFTEEDKQAVMDVHKHVLATVLSRYRKMEEKGTIEISTTPFFHPISPLIYDSETAHRAMPMVPLPPRFHWPQDIRRHMELAVEQHEKVFGAKPKGLWPSEGSVCPELIPLWKECGFEWFATDEDILFRSLSRQSEHHVQRSHLYDPYEAEWNGACLKSVFRDRSLSDFIGFSAAKNSGEEASGFILKHIHGIASATEHHRDPMVAIVLDGENAWEYFPDGGESFLDSWYRELLKPNPWQMTRIGDYTSWDIPRKKLHHLHTGSWIQGNFDIWIGDPEENLGWELLGQTRKWWEDNRAGVPEETAEAVWMEIYAAEGSDWFWWYGPDFQTDNDLLFDELFRTHLQNVYLLCGKTPPDSLFHPICRPQDGIRTSTPPIGLISPVIDGLQTSYFEWHESGRYLAGQAHGAMFQGEKIIREILFGFDMEHLYFCLLPHTDVQKHTGLTLEMTLEGLTPSLEFAWSPATGKIHSTRPEEYAGVRAAYRKTLELSCPIALWKQKPGDQIRVHFRILKLNSEGKSAELEQHPPHGSLEITLPNDTFVASCWSA